MKILPKPVAFEWDKGNIDKNLKKHKVTHKEAEETFDNEPKFFFEDEQHSEKERRYALYGQTKTKRFLTIVFTLRNEKVRIISARSMSRKERRSYEKIKKNPNV